MLKIAYHTRQGKISAIKVTSKGLYKRSRKIMVITFRAPGEGFSKEVTFDLSLER